MDRRGFALATSVVCAGVLVGCGTGAASRTGRGSRTPALRSAPARAVSSPVAQAQKTHERPSPPPPAQAALGGAPSASQAIRDFAAAYINWNADNVTADMRTLAARSVGQARSAMQLAESQTAGDYELQQGGIANSGMVEAVAPLAGRTNQYVVVTRESTSAADTTAYAGLRPAWHVAVAIATELGPARWVVSQWQPES